MLLTQAAGITVRDKGHCRRCGSELARHHRVRPVWIVAGVAKHPKTGKPSLVLQSRGDMPAPQNEYTHIACTDPRLVEVAVLVSAERPPPMSENLPEIQPRGDDSHCIKCNKLFARGDRVSLVYAVQGVGRDPETGAVAAQVSGSYEPKHEDCADPQLAYGKGGDSLISVG